MHTNLSLRIPAATSIFVTFVLLAASGTTILAQSPTPSPVIRLVDEETAVQSLQDPCELLSAMSSITLRRRDIQTTPPDYSDTAFSEASCDDSQVLNRFWEMPQVHWKPSGLWHNPLYFEEPNLERHGLTFGAAQPAVSAAHFFGNVVALPYHMANRHPHDCVYSLGDCRPGDAVAYYRHHEPFNKHAGLVEAAAVVGLVLLIP